MKKILIYGLVLLVFISLAGCTAGGNESQIPKGESQQAESGQTGEQTANETANAAETGNGNVKGSEEESAKDSKKDSEQDTDSVVYENNDYGFRFSLPESWKGYTIVTEEWEGLGMEDPENNKVTETGPLLSIRHPEWSEENRRQDIPILIFTLTQWTSLEKGEFHIGAAPIGPKELGRNNNYVFALPARYNYAFPTGYEEVEKILEANPLQTYFK